ncbi:MAG: 3'-5' exonuclease [Thermoanaerobaculia bacterium]
MTALVSALPRQAAERLLALCDGERSLVIFDLETTGADRLTDRIVEIAAIKLTCPDRIETYEKRINPGTRIPRESTAIHGISDEDVKDAPTFAQLAPEITAFFDGADLVGYNIRAFDIPVLTKEFERVKLTFPLDGRRIIDPQTIFFKREPRDLSAALRFFVGRDHESAHAALADVVASAEVLAGQLSRYGDLPQTLDGLHLYSTPAEGRFVDPDKRFFWRDGEAVFNFGDHRGRALAEVARSSPGYLDWMVSRDFPEDAKRIARDALKGIFPNRV